MCQGGECLFSGSLAIKIDATATGYFKKPLGKSKHAQGLGKQGSEKEILY